MTLKIYSFEDGKYKVVRNSETGLLVDILRHDLSWPVVFELLQFSKLFHSILNHLDKLESELLK